MIEKKTFNNPDVKIAAMQYLMTMLLQRLDAAGQVHLKEMIAGVEADQQAAENADMMAKETFCETLQILRFAQNLIKGR
ncbi:hypothetical protein ACTOWA_05890 [Herbaspirillum seropedicae]|uniref:hypothetical protein n=1 Tax=Herbaspirillum seropedicae TaxID=964 RepID=UPI003F8D5A5D